MITPPAASRECISIRPVSIGHEQNGAAALHVIEAIALAKRARDSTVQTFEEGDVLLLRGPSAGRRSAKYLMHLLDVTTGDGGTCARMHRHPWGDREVTLLTGQATSVVIATLAVAEVIDNPGLADALDLQRYTDRVPILHEDGYERIEDRHCLVVPPNSKFKIHVPTGEDHCFVAYGAVAAAITIHPDEIAEIAVTGQAPNMALQTEARQREGAQNCPPFIA